MHNKNFSMKYNNSYSVYMHISPSNKRYIGITSQNPNHRWRNGNGYKQNLYFYKAIQKYGWDNFQHLIVVTGLTKKEAENLEIFLIAQYDTTNRQKGYNIENGGNCPGTHSAETKAKISQKSKGNKSCSGRKITKEHIQALYEGRLRQGYKRKPLSSETKRKISIANSNKKFTAEHIQHIKDSHASMKGKNNPMYGKKHSEDTKRKISKKAKGRKLSEQQKKSISERAIKKAVIQMDLSGNVLNEYQSIKEAASVVNAKPQNIGAVCLGKQKSCRGYLWRYVNDNS